MSPFIVFDVDDTLYDQQLPFQKALQCSFPDLVKEMDISSAFLRFRFHSDAVFEKHTSGKWSLNYMRFIRIQRTLSDFGLSEITEKQGSIFQKYYEKELASIKIEKHSQQTLEYLHAQNIPMGLITNGPFEHQTNKIIQLNLSRWILPKNMIISGKVNCEKPQNKIFSLACETFNCTPTSTLYIGDSYENDVEGAKNAGWKSLWLNHRKRAIPTTAKQTSDFEVQYFDQLLPKIIEILPTI